MRCQRLEFTIIERTCERRVMQELKSSVSVVFASWVSRPRRSQLRLLSLLRNKMQQNNETNRSANKQHSSLTSLESSSPHEIVFMDMWPFGSSSYVWCADQNETRPNCRLVCRVSFELVEVGFWCRLVAVWGMINAMRSIGGRVFVWLTVDPVRQISILEFSRHSLGCRNQFALFAICFNATDKQAGLEKFLKNRIGKPIAFLLPNPVASLQKQKHKENSVIRQLLLRFG